MSKDNNNQAFPSWPSTLNKEAQYQGMTLRQYFANNCPDYWIEMTTPKTVGEMRDEMIARGIISPSAKHEEVCRSYNNKDEQKLYIALRYEYADAMIAEGNKQ